MVNFPPRVILHKNGVDYRDMCIWITQFSVKSSSFLHPSIFLRCNLKKSLHHIVSQPVYDVVYHNRSRGAATDLTSSTLLYFYTYPFLQSFLQTLIFSIFCLFWSLIFVASLLQQWTNSTAMIASLTITVIYAWWYNMWHDGLVGRVTYHSSSFVCGSELTLERAIAHMAITAMWHTGMNMTVCYWTMLISSEPAQSVRSISCMITAIPSTSQLQLEVLSQKIRLWFW